LEELVRAGVSPRQAGAPRRRQISEKAVSKRLEDFSREMSALRSGHHLSPSAHAALLALIAALADLLGEWPVT
jgi:hypothetical protein